MIKHPILLASFLALLVAAPPGSKSIAEAQVAPQVAQTVRDELQARGRARVLVELKLPIAARTEGGLTPRQLRRQRRNIRSAFTRRSSGPSAASRSSIWRRAA